MDPTDHDQALDRPARPSLLGALVTAASEAVSEVAVATARAAAEAIEEHGPRMLREVDRQYYGMAKRAGISRARAANMTIPAMLRAVAAHEGRLRQQQRAPRARMRTRERRAHRRTSGTRAGPSSGPDGSSDGPGEPAGHLIHAGTAR